MLNALKYTQKLEKAGFTREQAEAHMEIMIETIEMNLATKEDLKDFRNEMRAEFRDFKHEIRTDFQDFRNEIRSFGAELENKLIQAESRMTIKLGTIVTVALAACVALNKIL